MALTWVLISDSVCGLGQVILNASQFPPPSEWGQQYLGTSWGVVSLLAYLHDGVMHFTGVQFLKCTNVLCINGPMLTLLGH